MGVELLEARDDLLELRVAEAALTRTTMVFSILLETTSPTRSLR